MPEILIVPGVGVAVEPAVALGVEVGAGVGVALGLAVVVGVVVGVGELGEAATEIGSVRKAVFPLLSVTVKWTE